jgi:hypothetical protein
MKTSAPSDQLRFLHIGEDSLFLSRFSSWFETVAPLQSSYLVLTLPGASTLRFTVASPKVLVVRSRKRGLALLAHAVRRADVIIVHSMGAFGVATTPAPRLHHTLTYSGGLI